MNDMFRLEWREAGHEQPTQLELYGIPEKAVRAMVAGLKGAGYIVGAYKRAERWVAL